MPLLPYVRRELFLQAIKNRDASALPDPNNREELFLKAIAEDVALIPSGVSVVLPAAVSEMLANLPEAHTHTELFYKDIIDAILIATTVTDTTPFISRETAGGLPVSGTANLKKKLGNTVGVNQLFNNYIFSAGTYTWNNAGPPFSMIPGRTYLFFTDENEFDIRVRNSDEGIVGTGGKYVTFACTVASANYTIQVSGTSTKTANVRCIDLTLWYGSTDRIPADLLAHPENWGRYYAGSLAYNAGYLDSADGTVLKSIGRNQLPGGSFPDTITGYANTLTETQRTAILDCLKRLQKITAKVHYIVDADKTGPYVGELDFYAGGTLKKGLMSGSSWDISSFNFDEITNILLYGTSPTQTINFTDATISIYYDGESGYNQTYPYSVLAEVDTGSEVLRGVEGSRDEKLPSGAIQRNRARIDLGTLNYQIEHHATLGDYFYADVTALGVKYEGGFSAVIYSGISSRCTMSRRTAWTFVDKSMCFDGNQSLQRVMQIQIKDSAYNDAAAFKTAMSGVYFEYPLATPTTEQGTAFDPEYVVENGGTETWTNLKGIPQGHETDYMEYTT